MEVKGEIKSIIFNNTETGYAVLDVALYSGDLITAVGIFPPITESEQVTLRGTFKMHSRHGSQFVVEEVEVFPPSEAESIKRYLSSGLFKGVGAVTAHEIVSLFGNKTLEIIEKSPMQLYKVRGVSLKKAMEIGLAYNKMRNMQDAILFLQKYSISINMAIKIHRIYENQTIKLVSENPYRLIDDVDRIGFATADKIAQEMGIAADSDFRIKAGVTYLLKEASNKNGHTYLPLDMLIADCLQLLGFGDELGEKLLSNIDDMKFNASIMVFSKDDKTAVMLAVNYKVEKQIAKSLTRLSDTHSALNINPLDLIAEYEKINGITLHEMQKEAVVNVLERGVEVITGGPGTGKTTIIKCVLYIFKCLNKDVCLCAPTGRAAKRLSEATGQEAKTIHRLLDLDYKDGKGLFTYNDQTRLPNDVVIVDEVSMVDEYVFNALTKALKVGASLILVGDKDQLPSVGAGNVLSDVIGCGKFGVTCLTHIYRQAEESLIVTNAHKINKGQMPVLDVVDKDFFFEGKETPSEIIDTVGKLVTERLPKFLNINSDDIQVLCPMKKGVAGVENLNKEIRKRLNPQRRGEPEMYFGENVYRVGDKVMQIVNNYQQQWTVLANGATERGTGVFNGDMGYITEINPQSQRFTIRFNDDKVAVYPYGDLDQIVLAYTVSIHKSQGSEFDAVVIAVTSGNYLIMTRNLLYTAVTRAKKLCIIVGSRESVQKMVKNNYTAVRYTCLKDFLKDGDEDRLF